MKGYLKAHFTQFFLKISLRTERSSIATMLTTAKSAVEEVNAIVQEAKQNIHTTTTAIETAPSFEKNVAAQRLLDCKTELAKSNVLLSNILQTQKIICEQETLVRQERDTVFSVHNQLLSIIEAKIKVSHACKIAELTIKNIRNILPSARLQYEQIKTATNQISQHLKEAVHLDKEGYSTELGLLKNDAQCIKNIMVETNNILNDAKDILTNIKTLTQNARHQITETLAAKKLLDAGTAFENANILYNNLLQAHQLIVNEETNIKHTLDSFNTEMHNENSIENNLHLYADIKLVAINLQSIFPSVKEQWQKIKLYCADCQKNLEKALELQQGLEEKQIAQIESRKKQDLETIHNEVHAANKGILDISNILSDAKNSINEAGEPMVTIRQKNSVTSTDAMQKFLNAEEDLTNANILLKNILQTEEILAKELQIIQTATKIDFNNTSNKQFEELKNIQISAQNILSMLPSVEQNWQQIKKLTAQSKIHVNLGLELQQKFNEQEENDRKLIIQNAIQAAEMVLNNIQKIFEKAKKQIEEINQLMATTREKVIAPVAVQVLLQAETEISTANILIKNILQAQDMVTQESNKIKSAMQNNDSTSYQKSSSFTDIQTAVLNINIKSAVQNIESILPQTVEQSQKIEQVVAQATHYIKQANELKNVDLDKQKHVEIDTALKTLQSVKKIIINVDTLISKSKQYIDEMKKSLVKFQKNGSTQAISNIEAEIMASQILLTNIVQGREMMLSEQGKVETIANSLKSSSLPSDKSPSELYANIGYALQNVESLLPTIEEQHKKIKESSEKCKIYIQLNDSSKSFESSTSGAPISIPDKDTESNIDSTTKPTAEITNALLDDLKSSTEIQQLKLQIQQQEEQIEKLLTQLQELELPVE